MGILFRKTKEVFITTTLPSSFPYVKVRRGSLVIVVEGKSYPYISLEDYLSVMESYGVVVRTTEELSKVVGVSILEVADNLYLLNEELHSIYSLSTLLEALGVRIGTVNTQRKNYALYYDLFKDYFSKGKFFTQRKEGIVKDFEGRVFSSISEMCRYHGISLQTYYLRKERGLKGKDLFRKGRIRHGSTR